MRVRTLFESAALRVVDVACSAPRSSPSAEEFVDGPRIVVPRRGAFECHRGRDAAFVDATTALFLNAGEPYRIGHPVEGGDDCTVLAYDPALLLEAFGADRARRSAARPFRVGCAALPVGVQYRARLFHHAVGAPDRHGLEVEEAALALLREVAQAACPGRLGGKRGAPARRRYVERARAYLATNFDQPLALADIARAAQCSPFHLARVFRAELGTSLRDYQERLRHAAAIERLAQGEADLQRLALDLGFASHSHFTANFRRALGVTPSALRSRLTDRRPALRTILTAS